MSLLSVEKDMFSEAKYHLEVILESAPWHLPSRSLMAKIWLREGQAAEVVNLLQPIRERSLADKETLLRLAEALVMLGEFSEADSVYTEIHQQAIYFDTIQVDKIDAYLKGPSPEGTLNVLEDFHKNNPARSDQYFLLAREQLNAGKLTEAEVSIQDLFKQYPQDPRTHIMLGAMHETKQDFNAARKYYQQALELSSVALPALERLARLSHVAGDEKKAERYYRKVIDVNPKNITGLLGMASIKMGNAEYNEAASLIKNTIDAHPSSIKPLILGAELQLAIGQFSNALVFSKQALDLEPQNHVALYTLGRSQYGLGFESEAESIFLALKDRIPSWSDPLYQLGSIAESRRDNEAARLNFSAALKADPSNLDAALSQAKLQLISGNSEEAFSIALHLQRSNPNMADGWILEAYYHSEKADKNSFERAFHEAFKRQYRPDTFIDVVHLSRGYPSSSDVKKATNEMVKNWLDRYPEDTRVRTWLARSARQAGDNNTAESLYNEVLKVAPENVMAQMELALVFLESDSARALYLSEKAYKSSPHHPQIAFNYALILCGNDRYILCENVLLDLIRTKPSVAEYRMALVEVLLQINQTRRAELELKEILKLPDVDGNHSKARELLGLVKKL